MSSEQWNERILRRSCLCAGDGLVISTRGPGLFLQGLAVHGRDGTLLEGTLLGSDTWSRPDSCSHGAVICWHLETLLWRAMPGPDMPPDVVRAAFQYAQERNVPLAAFLGDECATLQMHPELEVRYPVRMRPLAGMVPRKQITGETSGVYHPGAGTAL